MYETNETETNTTFVSSTHSFNQYDNRSNHVGTPSSAFMPYNRVDSRARLDIGADSNTTTITQMDMQLVDEVLRLQKQKSDLESELNELRNGLNQVEIERSLQCN